MDKRGRKSSLRRPPSRRRVPEGGGPELPRRLRSSRRWRTSWAFLTLALAWPSIHYCALAECTGGYVGVEAGGVCCFEGCGTCGGDGCGDVPDTRGDDDCCIGTIEDNGIVCGENGAIAPCILPETTPAPVQSSDSTSASQTPTDSVAPQQATSSPTVEPTSSSSTPSASPVGGQMPTLAPSTAPTNFPFESSTCENGIAGWQSGEVCCAVNCGRCGGDNCAFIAGTEGAASCCVTDIREAGVPCGVAPCIITSPTPAPVKPDDPPTTAPMVMDQPTVAPMAMPTPQPTTSPQSTSPVQSPTTAPQSTMPMPRSSSTPAPATVDGGDPVATTPAPTTSVQAPSEAVEPECSNGQSGYQHGVVCCPLACGMCGGSGCESIVGTEGASDCCSDVVLGVGSFCNATVLPPCVIGTVDEVADAFATAAAARASGIMFFDSLKCVGGAAAVSSFLSMAGVGVAMVIGWWM